jgi:hypothetical protein
MMTSSQVVFFGLYAFVPRRVDTGGSLLNGSPLGRRGRAYYRVEDGRERPDDDDANHLGACGFRVSLRTGKITGKIKISGYSGACHHLFLL